MIKKLLPIFLIFIYLFSPLSANAKSKKKEAPKSFPVRAITVEKTPQTVYQDFAGRISAYREAEVRARVDGVIEKRLFKEGQMVQKDQQLYQIDDDQYILNMEGQQANLLAAKAALELSKVQLDRQSVLVQKKAASQADYDNAAAQYKTQIANVEIARNKLANSEILLDYTRVLAPISGRVGDTQLTEGAYVQAAQASLLTTIEQIDKVYVYFSQSNSDLLKYAPYQSVKSDTPYIDRKVQIWISKDEALPQEGIVTYSDQSVDPSTGSILLKAVINNPNFTLLPGMYVRVRMAVFKDYPAIVVPQVAVKINQNGAFVFLIKGNKLVPQQVTLGPMKGTEFIILNGLKDGDIVAVSDVTVALQMKLPVTIYNPPQGRPQGKSQNSQELQQQAASKGKAESNAKAAMKPSKE